MATQRPNRVGLTPWDPKSKEHVQRMYEQSVACGWRAEEVPQWKEKQLNGTKFLCWIVLLTDDSDQGLLASHLARYPDDKPILRDTADEMPRVPSLRESVPIGHISLEKKPDLDVKLGLPTDGVLWITSPYVSWAIQDGGLGRSAMAQIENLAVGEPLCGRVMALDTPAKESQVSAQFAKAAHTDRG